MLPERVVVEEAFELVDHRSPCAVRQFTVCQAPFRLVDSVA